MFRTLISKARSEEGFTLAALIVILTIIAMVVAFTVPEQWSMIMGRERDRQTIFLMKQYARAIYRYNAKNTALPTSLDQLADARQPRLIRGNGKYPCPLTGKDSDWVLVPPAAIEGGQPVSEDFKKYGNVQNPQAISGTETKLRKEASPDDYVGPFVGVRPKVSGKSFIALKGAENYDEWVYTYMDVITEYNNLQAALAAK